MKKAGLRKVTTQVQSGGKDITAAMAATQKQLETTPPEPRKMMNDRMAKQGYK